MLGRHRRLMSGLPRTGIRYVAVSIVYGKVDIREECYFPYECGNTLEVYCAILSSKSERILGRVPQGICSDFCSMCDLSKETCITDWAILYTILYDRTPYGTLPETFQRHNVLRMETDKL